MLPLSRNSLLISCAFLLVACGEAEMPATPEATQVESTAAVQDASAQIDEFFTTFTDRWMASNPNSAVSTAYFDPDTQNELEQQLTPWTKQYALDRIALAREGLVQLAQLDLDAGTPEQRLSGQLMQYMLQSRVDSEPYLDAIDFPLNQLEGANVGLASTFTLSHPFQNAVDVENYVTRLRLVGVPRLVNVALLL